MLLLFVAFVLLAFAYRRLVRPSQTTAKCTNTPTTQTTAHKKLIEEAFQNNPTEPPTTPYQRILILYATEYGFAGQVAQAIANELSTRDPQISEQTPQLTAESTPRLIPRVVNALHYRVIDFTRERFVIFVCSTTGDGAPPNEAAAFRDALVSTDVVLPRESRFCVLALGDKSYPHFCRAGSVFDSLLPGACRLLPRLDVDQENWTAINQWTTEAHSAILRDIAARPQTGQPTVSNDYLHAAIEKYATSLDASHAQYTRNNPYMAVLTSRRLLTTAVLSEGHKEVVQCRFDLSGSGIQYEVGDALAIVPKNNPQQVNRLLQNLASNGDEIVQVTSGGASITFESALTDCVDICTPRSPLIFFLMRHCARASDVILAKKILGFDARDPANRQRNSVSEFGKTYLADRLVVDVLMDFASATVSAQQLVNVLRPLYARYYSISSTPVSDEEECVAITVDVLRYQVRVANREGVASTFLQDRCRVGESRVPVFLSRNPNFRLPVDGSRPIIMIGPGTGIAPFIGFTEERVAKRATGANWLFFGCRFAKQDFLYEDELMQLVQRDCLHLHTAFSRDGVEKVYVQDRLKECAETLWRLIHEESAHVYICGDGGRMAADVDRALRDIVASCGGRSVEEAASYLFDLSEAKRYQRDVWVS